MTVTIIAKNQTAGEIAIDDLSGIRVPLSGQVTLTDTLELSEIYRSADLVTEINNNNILLNDGTNDLTKTASLGFIAERPNAWQPPSFDLGGFFSNGASAFLNAGAGTQWSFSQTGDDEILINIPLQNNGIDYDGSDLALRLHWALFSLAPDPADTVTWETDYAFVLSDGTEAPASIVDDNLVDEIVVDGMTENLQYTNDLTTMTGKAGATNLMITLRRNSSGGGADSYGSASDVYGVELVKA